MAKDEIGQIIFIEIDDVETGHSSAGHILPERLVCYSQIFPYTLGSNSPFVGDVEGIRPVVPIDVLA